MKDEQVYKGLRLLISDLEPELKGKKLTLGEGLAVLEKHGHEIEGLSLANAAREGFAVTGRFAVTGSSRLKRCPTSAGKLSYRETLMTTVSAR